MSSSAAMHDGGDALQAVAPQHEKGVPPEQGEHDAVPNMIA
jgi:hypothetical protein